MTIVEALKTGKIETLKRGSRWLYWANGPGFGNEQNHWVVREARRGQSAKVLIITDDEAEAVEALIGEE